MKKERDIIKRCCLFLLHDLVKSNNFSKFDPVQKEALIKAHEENPITEVRNYSKVRNRLLRLMKGEALYHQLVVIKKVAENYTLDEIASGIEKVLFPQVSKTEYNDLSSLVKEFKLITVGKV